MDNAIGTLGITPSVFWSLTWADLERLFYANKIRESFEWDRTRYVSTQILNSRFGVKNSDLKKPKDLFPLETDKFAPKPKPITIEDFIEQSNKLKRILPFPIGSIN